MHPETVVHGLIGQLLAHLSPPSMGAGERMPVSSPPFAGSGLIHALGWTLLHFLWQGAIVAAVFAFVVHGLRNNSANSRYAAGCAALLALSVCPLVTFGLLSAHAQPTATPFPAGQAAYLPSTMSIRAASGSSMDCILAFLIVTWLLGVTGLSIRLLGGLWAVHRLCRASSGSVPAWIETRAAEVSRRMGLRRTVRIRSSRRVDVPTVAGCFRAVILMPAGILLSMAPETVEALLAHELAHVRRHDYLVNLLQTCLETVLFYHPAVWWISRQVRNERENCCDDLAVAVLENKITYARALATLEELRSDRFRLALAASDGPLLSRIKRILGIPSQEAASASAPLLGMVLMAAVLSLAAVTHVAAMELHVTHARKSPPHVMSSSDKTDRTILAAASNNSSSGSRTVILKSPSGTLTAYTSGSDSPAKPTVRMAGSADSSSPDVPATSPDAPPTPPSGPTGVPPTPPSGPDAMPTPPSEPAPPMPSASSDSAPTRPIAPAGRPSAPKAPVPPHDAWDSDDPPQDFDATIEAAIKGKIRRETGEDEVAALQRVSRKMAENVNTNVNVEVRQAVNKALWEVNQAQIRVDIRPIHVPAVDVPETTVPPVHIETRVDIPKITVPAIHVPSVDIPETTIPPVHIETPVDVPKVIVPAIHIPAINVPGVHIPAIDIPAESDDSQK